MEVNVVDNVVGYIEEIDKELKALNEALDSHDAEREILWHEKEELIERRRAHLANLRALAPNITAVLEKASK